MPTQQQRFLDQALTHVDQISGKAPETRRIYGGLCHTFPVMVLTNGLCQALAFVREKMGNAHATDDGQEASRQVAYACLWTHAADVLGVPATETLLTRLRSSETATYLRDTRRILDAWVYYKRFAVSILNVQAGTDVTDPVASEVPAP